MKSNYSLKGILGSCVGMCVKYARGAKEPLLGRVGNITRQLDDYIVMVLFGDEEYPCMVDNLDAI